MGLLLARFNALGDNFECPYGEGSSSSKNGVDLEIFSDYFKGLMERVHGTGSSQKKVTMAGIGVAICDSRDGLLFEMRKPLDLNKDDWMRRQSVEGKALIEDLYVANVLDLKRITLYCAESTTYFRRLSALSGEEDMECDEVKVYWFYCVVGEES